MHIVTPCNSNTCCLPLDSRQDNPTSMARRAWKKRHWAYAFAHSFLMLTAWFPPMSMNEVCFCEALSGPKNWSFQMFSYFPFLQTSRHDLGTLKHLYNHFCRDSKLVKPFFFLEIICNSSFFVQVWNELTRRPLEDLLNIPVLSLQLVPTMSMQQCSSKILPSIAACELRWLAGLTQLDKGLEFVQDVPRLERAMGCYGMLWLCQCSYFTDSKDITGHYMKQTDTVLHKMAK